MNFLSYPRIFLVILGLNFFLSFQLNAQTNLSTRACSNSVLQNIFSTDSFNEIPQTIASVFSAIKNIKNKNLDLNASSHFEEANKIQMMIYTLFQNLESELKNNNINKETLFIAEEATNTYLNLYFDIFFTPLQRFFIEESINKLSEHPLAREASSKKSWTTKLKELISLQKRPSQKRMAPVLHVLAPKS